MNRQIVRTILAHELRMLLRYRRTVVLALVLPLVTVPLMLFAAKLITDRRQESLRTLVYRYAVTGSRADAVRGWIAHGKVPPPDSPSTRDSKEDPLADFKCAEIRVADPAAALQAGNIQFYIEALSGPEGDSAGEDALKGEEDQRRTPSGRSPDPALSEPGRLPGVPVIRIIYMADRQDSASGRLQMRSLLLRAQRSERDALLVGRGFPADPARVMAVEESNVASAALVTGSHVGRFLTFILMMLTLSGGSIVAIDAIAGEKERGSLETLLTTAAGRGEIIAAKQILIFAVALFITLVQVANTLVYISLKMISLPKDWVIEVPPAAVLTVLFLFLPLAAFVASVLLLISAYAKSYKEAQLYFFPVNIVSWMPALAAFLPGISLRSAIVLVPIANVSVAVRDVMVGRFDWPMLLVVFAANAAAAVFTARAAAGLLTQERLITASDADAGDFAGGPALFPKHVLRWYAVMGAALVFAVLNLPQESTMKGQVLVNELAVFLGAPLLMIWRYRLPAREALALRPVKPAVWLGVLMAIPSGALVATATFRLAGLVFPVPERMLEQFARDLLPAQMPLWQLVLYLAVLPAICEEISFRGVLLYGLRRRFRAAALVVVVGLIFGLFHVTLFRILPTAFLGMVLTLLALLTGSIFPGMLLHAGNNAFAVLMSKAGISISGLGPLSYAGAAAVFAFSFYIIYRHRTPYPL